MPSFSDGLLNSGKIYTFEGQRLNFSRIFEMTQILELDQVNINICIHEINKIVRVRTPLFLSLSENDEIIRIFGQTKF